MKVRLTNEKDLVTNTGFIYRRSYQVDSKSPVETVRRDGDPRHRSPGVMISYDSVDMPAMPKRKR